ncbi:MAG: DUF2207 domain-containing protein, partial [Synergistaceae bacterium]|nr:DUF2207 domain-containing protein [Synergistaceae bacterium]
MKKKSFLGKTSFLGKIGGLSFAFLSLCLLLCRPDVAWSLERILEMDVCAVVERDSSLVVTERIAFVAEWREIRRGLIRNVPVVHREGWRRIRGDFRLMSATLDGAPVPCEVKRAGDDVELHLGDERFLSQGAHEYVLTYSLTRQLIFHDDGVELYWNVTGNEWIFPIERASFRVELPQGA